MRVLRTSLLLPLLAISTSSCTGKSPYDIFSRDCWYDSKRQDEPFTAYFVIFDLGEGHSKIQVFSKFCRIDPKKDNPVTLMNSVNVREFKPILRDQKYLGSLVVQGDGIHNYYDPIRVLKVNGVGEFIKNERGGVDLDIEHLTSIVELPGESAALYRNLLLGRRI